MQRRQFIKRSGAALAAITALPPLIRNVVPYIYTGNFSDSNKTVYVCEPQFFYNNIFRFTYDNKVNKEIQITFSKPVNTSNVPKGAHIFKITDVIITSQQPKKAEVKLEWVKKAEGTLELPTGFPKKFTLYLDLNTSFVIKEKDKELAKLKLLKKGTETYYAEGNYDDFYDDDCFLTSACVFHKGLADDCYELETLRSLRENYMRGTIFGDALLEEYQEIGPLLVRQINAAPNRTEILDHLYSQLVLPSVAKIEKGELAEAVEGYKLYVEAMKSAYLPK